MEAKTKFAMIEFRGTYYPLTKSDSTAVLIQYDGVLLHIWHLADPFHRLFSSDEFHISKSVAKKRHLIKLPNGGRVETDDRQSFDLLAHSHKKSAHPHISMIKQCCVLALLGATAIILVAWWLAGNGLFFKF